MNLQTSTSVTLLTNEQIRWRQAFRRDPHNHRRVFIEESLLPTFSQVRQPYVFPRG